jgi:twitching motility protein PilT
MDQETLSMLLAAGIKHGASDIHFRVGDAPMYRVDGQLIPLKHSKLVPNDTRTLCALLVRDPVVQQKLDEIQEHDTSYSLAGIGRFRVSIYRQRGSVSVILRVIPTEVPTIQGLGLPAVVGKIAESKRGLVLVTGTTGSGKSTTLAAMVRHINETRRCHILTIEDPIEFLHAGIVASVSQRELGIDTRNFKVALRAALRADPDVILVGEMRDPESVDIALKAGETGHLVLSSVHTTDAPKTLHRLVSMFPADEQQTVRYRIADALKATVSQRLVPRADSRGRIAAAEIMIVTPTVQEHLRDSAKLGLLKDVIEKGRSQYGSQSFDQHLTDLLRDKAISMDTALQACSNPSNFQRALSYE